MNITVLKRKRDSNLPKSAERMTNWDPNQKKGGHFKAENKEGIMNQMLDKFRVVE